MIWNQITCNSKQIEILEHVRKLLNNNLLDRINSILNKNPDYQNLIIKLRNQTIDNNNLKYLTLHTVNVERSFSILRNVLNERASITHKSINNYMIIRYNKLIEYS